MSRNLLKSQLGLLKILAEPKSRYRNAILLKADKKLIHVICEIIENTLAGNITISDSDKEKLKKFRNTLHVLIQKSSLKSKKRILIQKGGFLQFLIPAVITGLSSIISSVISKE